MKAPATVEAFLDLVRKSGLVEPFRLRASLEQFQTLPEKPTSVPEMAKLMLRYGILTRFQSEQLLSGRWRG
jgi:hypothetical protein